MSFRVLVHAEVESFLEDRAFELFDAAWAQWSRRKAPNRVVLSLVAYGAIATSTPPEKLGGDSNNQKAYDDIAVPIQKAQAAWRAAHKDNHGIKEANILALLLPLGILASDLDTTLLADLTSFGAARGTVAHRSSVGVSVLADPRTELEQARQLVSGLESIDGLVAEAIDELKRIAKAIR